MICPQCSLNLTGMTPVELEAHRQFDVLNVRKSIPHQDNPRTVFNFYGYRDDRRIDEFGWEKWI